eukprot:7612657-Pyramimonas_sp.AAC.1
MASEDRVYSADQVDDIICAELPPKPLREDFDTDEQFATAFQDYVYMSNLVAEFMVTIWKFSEDARPMSMRFTKNGDTYYQRPNLGFAGLTVGVFWWLFTLDNRERRRGSHGLRRKRPRG